MVCSKPTELLILRSTEQTESKIHSIKRKSEEIEAEDTKAMMQRPLYQGDKEKRERSGKSPKVITSLKTGSSSPPPIIHNRNSGFCIGFTELSKNEIEVENHFYKFFDITDSKKFLTFNGTTK